MRLLRLFRARLSARTDSEHEQALLRIVIVGLILGYMALFHGWPSGWSSTDLTIVIVLSGFFFVAVTLFAAICVFPGKNVPRRLIGMLADSGGSTWYMCMAGEYGFSMIGVYLFITFGNGFRYGRRYLFGCQLLCLLGYVGVLKFVPYWQQHGVAGVGLLIALVVLPLYVSTLLKRIQEARARAEEASTAKTTFLANMSHEMRTPLNGIVGVVDLFRTTALSSQQTELVRLLRHSVSVLRSLVDDVLDISKIEAGKLSIEVASFDLHATINGLMQLLRPHARSKGLELHAGVDPALDYKLRGDSHHIRQILLNLLGNSIKFTEKGEVALTVCLQTQTPDGVTVRFEVKDTGIGISEDALPRIFERFVQADQSTTRRFGGSGLGTTIAKQLVELMGGQIGVLSRLGEGSTFWFEVPLLKDPIEQFQVEGTQDLALASTVNQRTILVADQLGTQFAIPLLAAIGERFEHILPTASVGARLDALLAAGECIRAIIAVCNVDSACAAFLAARQRLGETPLALIFIAEEPLSVVDNARVRSIREACVLGSSVTPRLLANAIHAATAGSDRQASDVFDLTSLIKRERASLHILVAEDNATNQTIIRHLLEKAGHTVIAASDGEEALDCYEREAPDLAILDFNMPHRTGIEVIQAIRAMEPPGVHMPAIILSASVTREARERATRSGADEFVGKPFDAAFLLERIDRIAPNGRRARRAVEGEPKLGPAVVTNLYDIDPRVDADGVFDGLVDQGRLAELEDIARDSSFMTELLRGFRTDVVAILNRVDTCLRGQDHAQIPDLMHSLKGAAVGVGAKRLAQRCDEVSTLTPVTDPGKLSHSLEQLRECFDATLQYLDSYVRRQHKVSL